MLAYPLAVLAFASQEPGARADARPSERIPTSITAVSVLPTAGSRSLYPSNRAPLSANPLIKLPIGSIKPKGWLLTQLQRMGDGFVGHLPELSKFCRADSGWLQADKVGWEEAPYWLRGYGDLGYVLNDGSIIEATKKWLDAVVASQDEDGYFGPKKNKENRDVWPNMVMLYALRSRYEATGDDRIIPMMTRYFRYRLSSPPGELYPYRWGEGPYRSEWWQHNRAGEELDSVYWLYNQTGEAWLLELAERIHREGDEWVDDIQSWHGVNICQSFDEPATYYQQSKNPNDLRAAHRNYKKVYEQYGQVPGGMFGADENCRTGHTGPRQAAETCSMVEIMHSFESLLKITGEVEFADKCEEVAFDSLPVSMTADLRGLHYLAAPNMVQLDRRSKSPGLQNGGNMLGFDPSRYRCCQHNVAMGWPYYAEHLWFATQERGLAAVLYAACTVTAKIGDGTEVTITEETDYPFSEDISLRIATPYPVHFPIALRIPGWCNEAKLSINDDPQAFRSKPGGYLTIDRTWSDGDRILLQLPMKIRVTRWEANHNAVSIHRGPLTYSLKISERWQRYDDDPDGHREWPAYEVFPTTPWNYGLVLDESDPASSFEVKKKRGRLAAQPFDVDASPIEILAWAKRIDAWQLDRTGLVGELQASPARVDGGQPERITLIPMGCARLRISAFPTVSSAADAHQWSPPPTIPHEASYEHDDIAALSDGIEPKSSNDHDVPRFTFWPHKGTTEWVTFKFETPRRVAQTHVYWFDDSGRGYCRVPESWAVFWKKGDSWQPVTNIGGGGTKSDRYNSLTFDPITTTELKLEVALRKEYSGGILEWIVGHLGPE